MTRQGDLTEDEARAHMMMVAQGRIEDKAIMQEMSADIKGMSKDISKMAVAITENIKDNHYTTKRVDDIESKQLEQASQIKTISDAHLIKKIRWGMIGTVAGAIALIVGAVSSVVITSLDKLTPFLNAILTLSEQLK